MKKRQATGGRVACYIRVSTGEQDKGRDSQRRALTAYCENHGLQPVWYVDKISGAKDSRPALNRPRKAIFSGEVSTVVCWKLDRLSRSLRDGVNLLCHWLEQGVRIVAVTQQLDFSGPTGQLVASVLFAVAAMERENIRENTRRGMAAAKARGVKLGKRPKLFAKDIVPMLEAGDSVLTVARKLGKTRQAIYDCLRRESVALNAVRHARCECL